MTQEIKEDYFVYFFAESNIFKVGMTKNLPQRIFGVSIFVNVDESFCIKFTCKKDAMNAEKTIHWLFRGYSMHIKRSGGTEFFKIEAYDAVIGFVTDNKDLIGYDKFISGEEFKKLIKFKPQQTTRRLSLNLDRRYRVISRKIKSEELTPTIRAVKFSAKCSQITAETYLEAMHKEGVLDKKEDGSFVLKIKKPKLYEVKSA